MLPKRNSQTVGWPLCMATFYFRVSDECLIFSDHIRTHTVSAFCWASPLRGDSPQQGPFEARSKLKACVCNHKLTITTTDAAKAPDQPGTMSQVGHLET